MSLLSHAYQKSRIFKSVSQQLPRQQNRGDTTLFPGTPIFVLRKSSPPSGGIEQFMLVVKLCMLFGLSFTFNDKKEGGFYMSHFRCCFETQVLLLTVIHLIRDPGNQMGLFIKGLKHLKLLCLYLLAFILFNFELLDQKKVLSFPKVSPLAMLFGCV